MSARFLPIILFLLALLPSACGKIELPVEDSGNSGNEPDKGKPAISGDTLLPSQVLQCRKDTFVCVKGYIVGYVRGTSLAYATFGVPEDGPNSNMLLADTPDETSVANCLVAELRKNNNDVPREEINLYDHPEHFQRRIILIGYVTSYFKTTGLKNLYYYKWDNNPSDSDQDGDDIPPTHPDTPTPDIDDHPQLIPDGR